MFICELQGDQFSSSYSAAFCVNSVEFTLPKINFVCVNGCRNKIKKCELRRHMRAGVKFYCLRGDSVKNI